MIIYDNIIELQGLGCPKTKKKLGGQKMSQTLPTSQLRHPEQWIFQVMTRQ